VTIFGYASRLCRTSIDGLCLDRSAADIANGQQKQMALPAVGVGADMITERKRLIEAGGNIAGARCPGIVLLVYRSKSASTLSHPAPRREVQRHRRRQWQNRRIGR